MLRSRVILCGHRSIRARSNNIIDVESVEIVNRDEEKTNQNQLNKKSFSSGELEVELQILNKPVFD